MHKNDLKITSRHELKKKSRNEMKAQTFLDLFFTLIKF
jgi:hypothetical protein